MILETVAENPWKSFDEIAAICSLSSGEDVRKVMESNRDLYNRILMGFEDGLGEEGREFTDIDP